MVLLGIQTYQLRILLVGNIKMIKTMAIVNWGMGLEVLKALHKSPCIDMCAVITQCCDVMKKNDEWINAVYKYSQHKGISTYAQGNTSLTEMHTLMKERDIDLIVVHAFMKRIPRDVFSFPKYGTVNIHASLLPRHRGPAPSKWVLKCGDDLTGLTAHYIDDEYDAGSIICQRSMNVEKNDTVETILENQKQMIPDLIENVIRNITDPEFKPFQQDSSKATYAPRIK